MSDLKSRIGPKPGEKQPHFPNKSWRRPGLPTPDRTGTNVWNTSDSTNEGDSDSGSYNDDQGSNSPHPPLSFSNSASPDKRSLQERLMEGPIVPEIIHNRPETEQPSKASKTLLERVEKKDDGLFEPQEFHHIGNGDEMDIDQDNDGMMFSGSEDRIHNSKNIGNSLHVRLPLLFFVFGSI